MKIDITDLPENKAIVLLADVIKIEQQNIETISENLLNLEGKVDAQADEKSGLEKTVKTLTDEKSGLEGKVNALTDEKSSLEKTVETLIKENDKLQKELEIQKKDLFGSKLNSISVIFRQSISTLEQKWQEFITEILKGINELTQSNDDLKDIVSKLHGKNGWLTRTSSLYWWSTESNIGKFIPSIFDAHSVFHDTFEGFIAYLGTLNFHIDLPQGDFSGKILNYKPDYDEETCWVKDLFPQYEPEGFVLCEISFLSINGNTGKCIGVR